MVVMVEVQLQVADAARSGALGWAWNAFSLVQHCID